MNSMLTVLLENQCYQIDSSVSSRDSSCACYLSTSYFMAKHLVLRAILPANKTMRRQVSGPPTLMVEHRTTFLLRAMESISSLL